MKSNFKNSENVRLGSKYPTIFRDLEFDLKDFSIFPWSIQVSIGRKNEVQFWKIWKSQTSIQVSEYPTVLRNIEFDFKDFSILPKSIQVSIGKKIKSNFEISENLSLVSKYLTILRNIEFDLQLS